ncbi:hypothetical protein Rhal01_02512 [Rubritalea halochordaticola]|uniref:Lipoprotein n=1 Tax=Rubritalea halochordaticola TaxID=714537 RepID=A0ABP9V323_9BACT
MKAILLLLSLPLLLACKQRHPLGDPEPPAKDPDTAIAESPAKPRDKSIIGIWRPLLEKPSDNVVIYTFKEDSTVELITVSEGKDYSLSKDKWKKVDAFVYDGIAEIPLRSEVRQVAKEPPNLKNVRRANAVAYELGGMLFIHDLDDDTLTADHDCYVNVYHRLEEVRSE